jgi:hypothetical protein
MEACGAEFCLRYIAHPAKEIFVKGAVLTKKLRKIGKKMGRKKFPFCTAKYPFEDSKMRA